MERYAVLVVDDNAPLREAISRSFVRRGWRVGMAANGVAGLDAIRRESFDVVISDLNMPERGGLWLWHEAISLQPELRGRFVLISSEPIPGPTSMSLALGSAHFEMKPVLLETLWGHAQEIVQRTNGSDTTPSGQLG